MPTGAGSKAGVAPQDFQTMQVEVGKLIWIIKYEDSTAVLQGDKNGGAQELSTIPKGKEVLVSFTGSPAQPTATTVAVKQPYKVPAEKLIEKDELAALIEKGPEKGGYTLIDARPTGSYLAGHIPTARSLPYGAFDKRHGEVLPTAKEDLVIFYCGGFT